jgi:hypothetical protein
VTDRLPELSTDDSFEFHVLIAAAPAVDAGIDFPLLPYLQHDKFTLQTRTAVLNGT